VTLIFYIDLHKALFSIAVVWLVNVLLFDLEARLLLMVKIVIQVKVLLLLVRVLLQVKLLLHPCSCCRSRCCCAAYVLGAILLNCKWLP